MAEIRVGISGWTYAPWRGVFYPPKLAQRLELHHASRQLDSIEINGTFYRLQKPESFRAWDEQTPEGFVFAIKATQYITHRLRLKDAAQPLANFFASGLLCLGKKLGPILWQLPPNLPYVDDRLLKFIDMLPMTSRSAEALAQRHDAFIDGRAHTQVDSDYPVRHAFEFRHSSYEDAHLFAELKQRGIAVVLADSGLRALKADDITAGFVYVRMHGQGQYAEDGYDEPALNQMADRIRGWVQGESVRSSETLLPAPGSRQLIPRDVFVYFDNDAKAHAPRDAQRLRALLDKRSLPRPVVLSAG